jgi:hypothetical protein
MHNRLCQRVVRFDSSETSAKLPTTVDGDEGAAGPIELTAMLCKRRRLSTHTRLECPTRQRQQSLLIHLADHLETGSGCAPVVCHQIAAAM